MNRPVRRPFSASYHLDTFIGAASARFPYPFFGYTGVRGEELLLCHLTADHQVDLARSLGTFLKALHDPGLAQTFAADLAEPVRGRLTANALLHKADGCLSALSDPDIPRWRGQVRAAMTPAGDVRLADKRCLVHGDLHLRHVLVHRHEASGIIDWGDMHIGHPAQDLSLYYSAFDTQAQAAFGRVYGDIPPAWHRYAQAMAIYSCLALATHAQATHAPLAAAAALAAFRRCIE